VAVHSDSSWNQIAQKSHLLKKKDPERRNVSEERSSNCKPESLQKGAKGTQHTCLAKKDQRSGEGGGRNWEGWVGSFSGCKKAPRKGTESNTQTVKIDSRQLLAITKKKKWKENLAGRPSGRLSISGLKKKKKITTKTGGRQETAVKIIKTKLG